MVNVKGLKVLTKLFRFDLNSKNISKKTRLFKKVGF